MTTGPDKSTTTSSAIFHWRSLKTRLTLFILAIFLVSIWSLAFYSSYTLKRNLEQLLSNQQFSAVSIVASDINQELEDRIQSLEMIASKITPAMLGNATFMQTFLESQVSFPILFNYGGIVLRHDGIAIAEVPNHGRIGINYSDRDYMIEVLKGKTTISRTVMGKTSGSPFFSMLTPIRDTKGNIIGVLAGATDLSKPNFLGKITDNKYGKTGGYLLVSPKIRTVVYATDKKRIMEVLPTPGINPLIDSFIQGYEGSGITIRPGDGVETLSSAKGIPLAGWYVVALMPTSEAFAPVHDLQKRMLLATIFLSLLAGGLTWWMLKRQLAPVFSTIKTLFALSNTDQPPQPLPITRQDEIGELIGGFNHLLETLAQRGEALRESEERRRTLFEGANDGILLLSDNGTVLEVNESFARMHGYSTQEMQSMDLNNFDTSETSQLFYERRNRLLDEGTLTFEVEHYHKDGHVFSLEVSASLISSGAASFIQCFHRDITDRKHAEEALRESEEKFFKAFKTSPYAITITQPEDGKFIEVNDAFTTITGFTREEALADSSIGLQLWINEEDRRHVVAALRNNQAVVGKEYPFRTKSGKVITCLFSAQVIQLVNTQCILSSINDITERKRAEEVINTNEARLRAIFDSVQDFIFIKDTNRRYLTINNYFQKRFQIDPSVFLGHTDEEIALFENRDRTVATIQNTDALVLGGETAHYELQHRVCGTLIIFDILKTPIRDGQGSISGICGLSRDITKRRKVEEEKRSLEERLNRAEKMESLGTLAGGVAHDLNNVLGIVVGYAEMLMDEMDESNPMRDDLKKILEGGNRSAAIVHDLLTLARRGVHTKKTVNLNATITDCQKLPEFEKAFSYNPQVKLQTDLELDLLNIIGSPVHLSKTIINLASNAVEAMPNGGVLKIATSNQYLDMPIHGYDNIREGDYVVLIVSDTGEGISERDIKRIFEPFYTKKIMGKSGTGLGLAVVWGTIKDHNGYINVESTEGKGTTFTLYFPVTREDMASDQISISMSEYVGKGETILVVDDVNRQRELASRMITKLNYSVSTVASGEEAIEYLKKNKADLIVLDMIMDPGIDGLETYEKILEINPAQKAIIVSGFSESDRVKEAQKIGAGAYVPKPYVRERLGMAVRKELDRK